MAGNIVFTIGYKDTLKLVEWVELSGKRILTSCKALIFDDAKALSLMITRLAKLISTCMRVKRTSLASQFINIFMDILIAIYENFEYN